MSAITYEDFRIGHASLQFSDTPTQWTHDTKKIFSRDCDWYGGTEGGETDNWTILRRAAIAAGYVIRRYKSNWIAVKKSLVRKGTVIRWGEKTVIDTNLVAGPGHDTNYIFATWLHPNRKIGQLSHVTSHYPTKGEPSAKDPARRVNLKWTKKIGITVGRKVAELGVGTALAFYSGDQNINDKLADTFFEQPLTTCWDERNYYPGTLGSRTIDVIASLDKDARVKCIGAASFKDRNFFLNTDHDYIEARYRVQYMLAA